MLPDGTRCATCRRRPPRTTCVVALGDYRANESLRDWILALKHRGRVDLAESLGRAMAARLQNERGQVPRSSMLIPVPLHPLRRLQRGYDQARCLARAAAEALDVSFRPLLVRRRWTPSQGAPGSPARGANVHGAFAVPAQRLLDLTGVRVWLVDDVVTSGATIDACAALLAPLGARRIGVLCAARAGGEPMFT
jgi:ComF family protein